jgi:hypothetical protein
VDDRIHASDLVYLLRNASRLSRAAEIPNDHSSGTRREISERRSALRGTCVQDDVVAFGDERARSGEAESIGGARDEDATHVTLLCWRRICV